MFSQFSYPIICSDKFEETVAFYEDHFGYAPAKELNGFIVMQRSDYEDAYLAIMNCKHGAIPKEYRKPTSGMILSYPVADVKATYQEMYWEGLSILSEPEDALCGRKHFFVEDPNGILVNVAQEIEIESAMSPEVMSELCLSA